MTYSADRDSSILEEFDEWYESVGSNINSDSSDEDIEKTNVEVQEFMDELDQQIKSQ